MSAAKQLRTPGYQLAYLPIRAPLPLTIATSRSLQTQIAQLTNVGPDGFAPTSGLIKNCGEECFMCIYRIEDGFASFGPLPDRQYLPPASIADFRISAPYEQKNMFCYG